MTEPAPERAAEPRPASSGPAGPVLWAGIAWLAVATFGLVPTALLFVRELTAMIAFMVGVALVGLPLYTLFELWHKRTMTSAVRSAMYSFGLAALVLALWTAGRGFEWTVAAISALLGVPGALSLLAARQIFMEGRQRRTRPEPEQDADGISAAEIVLLVLILFAVLVGAVVLLEPTFSERFVP